MRQVVGISFKIKRAWLDAYLDRLAGTTAEEELRPFLDDLVKAELPSKETRAKTSGIIHSIWGSLPHGRVALRDRAVALLPRISGQERIWLHWGMTALAYPFFRDTTEVVGRLLALQDDFTTAQVQARIVPKWGDRVTSKRAAQYLLNTLVDWEVLRATKAKGHFLLARRLTAGTPELQLWLVEALLGANAADEIEAQQLLRLPESFPFALGISVNDLRRHEGFDIHRQGLDMDMVALRRVRAEPPPKPKTSRKARKASRTSHPSLFDLGHGEALATNGRAWTVADAPFAALLAECAELIREGRHHSCIGLALAVVESAVLLVWRTKVRKRRNQAADLMKALGALHANSLVGEDLKQGIERIWSERHTIPLLRQTGSDRDLLEEVARTSLTLANDLVREFFGYSERDGVIVPAHPEYWSFPEAGKPALAGH